MMKDLHSDGETTRGVVLKRWSASQSAGWLTETQKMGQQPQLYNSECQKWSLRM